MENKKAIHQNFLNRLKEMARKKFGLNEGKDYGIQTKIADAIGTGQRTVSNWFNKNTVPNAEQILKIYQNLGISPNELFGIEETKQTKEEPISASFIKDLINQIGPNKNIEEKDAPLVLSILNLTNSGIKESKNPDLLIIQNRVHGRRKNIIPIKINGEDRMNIILLEREIKKVA